MVEGWRIFRLIATAGGFMEAQNAGPEHRFWPVSSPRYAPMKSVLLTVLLLATGAVAANANDSRYTDLKPKSCQTISQAEDESGSVSLKCKGLDGYPVYVKEGDLRQSAFFGPIDDLYVERAFESFGTFNHAGEKVEWRVDAGGKPVAAILRYVIEHADPKTGAPSKSSQGQILVVSKVAQKDNGQGCVAGYVDALANPDANDLARQIGDTVVPDFRCGSDEPTWHGKKGERADEPMRYLPQ